MAYDGYKFKPLIFMVLPYITLAGMVDYDL